MIVLLKGLIQSKSKRLTESSKRLSTQKAGHLQKNENKTLVAILLK